MTKTAWQLVHESIPEAVIHTQISDWLTAVLIPDTTYYTTIENSNQQGGKAGRIKQAKNKRRGVKTGFPDILIIYRGRAFFLEVKRYGKAATPRQKEEHAHIEKSGGVVRVVHNIEEVRQFFMEYQIQTRECIYD